MSYPQLSKNTQRHSTQLAHKHSIYTTSDVLALYGISKNTLSAWIKNGLPYVRDQVNLFRGADLKAFHDHFKQSRRVKLAPLEAYCFHCKKPHAAGVALYEFRQIHTQQHHLIVQCPSTNGQAYKIISETDVTQIKTMLDSNYSAQRAHYNGLADRSKTGTARKQNSLRNHDENFKLHYHYQEYLQLSRGMAHSTIQAALRSIRQFDVHSANCTYHEISTDQIKWFKDGLEERLQSEDISERRSASTIVHTLLNLKDFFLWLESNKEIKFATQRLGDYFKPSNRLMKLANVVAHKYIPTMDDLYEIVRLMPFETFMQRRDRAIIAYLMATALRNRALLSIRIQDNDFDQGLVMQDPHYVQTKNAKAMLTAFFPVDEDIMVIISDWVGEIKAITQSDQGPLFPRMMDPIAARALEPHAQSLLDDGLPRRILKRAIKAAGKPVFTPHKLRHAIAEWGLNACAGLEEYASWSRNLGHNTMATTFGSYVKPTQERQNETMKQIRHRLSAPIVKECQDLRLQLDLAMKDLPSNSLELVLNVARNLKR